MAFIQPCLDTPAATVEAGLPPRILVLETMGPDPGYGPDSSGTAWLRALVPAAHLVPVPAYDGTTTLPDASGFDAVIIPGSVSAVYERAPWMLRLEAYLRQAHEQHVQMLGICFGHQILASALGGTVIRSPLGREFGFCPIELTDAGRQHPFLFDGLRDGFLGAQGHYDTVSELPPGATLLAQNGYGVQSFQLGATIGIQFHPEITPPVLADVALADVAELEAAGCDARGLAAQWRVMPPAAASAVVPSFVRGVLAIAR